MNTTEISIEGIDKATLLLCLAAGQIPASYFTINGICPPFADKAEAEKAVARGYIDYFSGRAIKCNLNGSHADFRLYDRDAGASFGKLKLNKFITFIIITHGAIPSLVIWPQILFL